MEKDIVRGYVRYLKLQRNLSGNTLDAYQRDLRKLLDYLEAEGKDPREVTLEDLEHFSQEQLKEKKHNWELIPEDRTVLCADYRMSGVGSASCGPDLDDFYRLSEKEFAFGLWFSARKLNNL